MIAFDAVCLVVVQAPAATSPFGAIDWIVVGLYFAAIAGIVRWAAKKRDDSTADYFLAGRHVGWFVIGASIFASNVGAEHVVGLSGEALDNGLVMGHYELHSWLCLVLGWVFVPFYLRSRVFTMPEFLERRFGPASRWLLAVIMLIGYVLTKISVTILAGAVVLKVLMGVPFWPGAAILVTLTGIYTVFGGLRAVVYTEAMQAIVLIIGSVVITFTGLAAVGGWDSLVEQINAIDSEKLNMFRPLTETEKYPWTGMLFAPPIIGLWYWCTDQYIVQRVLTARNEQQARRGTIFAGYLKMLPFFIFMIPGLVALALKTSGKLQIGDSNETFPKLVEYLLPVGVRGLVAGGLIAALMSSLAAVFSSSSALFTMDIYRKLRPDADDRSLVRIGRISTVVLVGLGLLWIPFLIDGGKGIYAYLQGVQAYLAPPIAAVFFLGLFIKRLNGIGAIVTLAGGLILGAIKFTTESIVLGGTPAEEAARIAARDGDWVATMAQYNFLHFAIFLFVFCCILLVTVSFATPPPSEEQIRGLTFATMSEADRAESRATWSKMDVVHSVIIVVAILAILFYFSPLNFG